MSDADLFARIRALVEQERLLLDSLHETIPDDWAREPIEQRVREGFRRERQLARRTGYRSTGESAK